jgi:methylphosphotriester-DNA--protein-cysteine methyltransferase
MTLQNRVTPFGEIVAIAPHGTLMGNRGRLHDVQRRVTKTSARSQWLTCRLQWNGIQREIMSPDSYTELFFLDEATALAAGHRPCNDCRSERLRAFQQAWARGVEGRSDGATLVSRIDPVMQRDRLVSKGVQRRYAAQLGGLPDGTMLQVAAEEGAARLKWRGRLLRWAATGYEDPRRVDDSVNVMVLTPACTVRVLAAGYVPEVHPTADAGH